MKPKNGKLSHPSNAFLQSHYLILRIALDEIKPSIWRRVAVPASVTLDLLHDIFQVTMGWGDYHLHQFTICGQRFTEDPEEPDHGVDETGLLLADLIGEAKSKFAYDYDFGDGWRHTVIIEEMEPIPDHSEVEMTCLGGKRCCPPEDVGGPWGYENYLQALANPKHEEHKELLRWRGSFNAELFNLDQVNRELRKLARWSRDRSR